MEKRLVLAVVLSFMVLYLWAALTPKSLRTTTLNHLQTSANKDVIVGNAFSSVPAVTESALQLSPTDQKEESVTLETDKLKVVFSNKGGNLKSIHVKDFDFDHPLLNYNNVVGYEDQYFQLDEQSKASVTYSYTTSTFKIFKIYTVSDDDYLVTSSIVFENISEMSNLLDVNIENYTIHVSNLNKANDPEYTRDRSLYEYLVYGGDKIIRKANAFKFKLKESKVETEKVIWTGFRSRYYSTILKPDFETQSYEFKVISDEEFRSIVHPAVVSVAPASQIKYTTTIYTGPENLDTLKSYNMEFEKVRKYYRLGIFDVAAKFIYSVMHYIHKFAPNWGLSIIFVSMFVYLLTYPLTVKSMRSMKKMAELGPKTQQLKEKYKDNPQKLNTEIMDLYKKNKVNPLGGCLPILIQMPIFIGLYQVLWRSVEFKGASFLWIKDLTHPDALITFPSNIPLVGSELNILPLIMTGIMFVQQRISLKNMVTTDPSQMAQQKIMANVMPVMLGVLFYHFASGLTLYFTLFYLFSTITQLKMNQEKKAVQDV